MQPTAPRIALSHARSSPAFASVATDALATRGRRRSRAAVPAPESRSVLLSGQIVPYVLKVSAQARRVRLVVRPESGLEVVVPRGVAPAAYEPVLHEKARWIVTTLERVALEAASAQPPPLATGRVLPFAGRDLTLTLRTDAPPGHFRASLAGNSLTLALPAAGEDLARTALEAWYRKQAPGVFAARLALMNQSYGFSYGRVSIKNQKSRWGSCSKLGNLNFNWRLLLAPLPVLDYVVVHELCHLKELNHAPRFWKLVARVCPDYATHRRWLRQHGRELAF